MTKAQLNTSVLKARPVRRGCLSVDFGTAASKIAYEPGADRFEPLAIGDEGDPFWVRSAIAIDKGKMVFGGRARLGGSPVLTSFKSRLWGDPARLDAEALTDGDISFSYRDCVQAYLAFLTQLGARRLREKKVSPYTPRRYAMPFAYDEAHRAIRRELGEMIKRAVVLADTFEDELLAGIEVARMREALDALRTVSAPEWLLAEPPCVGEPVAAGAFAMDSEIGKQTVYMIADVGAGTTDFCILCLKKRADGDLEPIQIRNGALSISVAGDAVDEALVEFLVQEAGEQHRKRLMTNAREIKERLFAVGADDDEEFYHDLPAGDLVRVNRREFLASLHWRKIARQLRSAQANCFDGADRKYLQDFGGGAIRIVLTGGGSALPLTKVLAGGRSGGQVRVKRTKVEDFPVGIRQRFSAITGVLPRLAVALGGSRDTLPADFDRSAARTSTGVVAPYVPWAFDKTKTGLEDERDSP
ncbi:MAG TPA: hypothetical protein VMS43_08780 [Allosphingosinicella sp.]|nr:hypothetical protein [Allosphingosinicella sp.]